MICDSLIKALFAEREGRRVVLLPDQEAAELQEHLQAKGAQAGQELPATGDAERGGPAAAAAAASWSGQQKWWVIRDIDWLGIGSGGC